MINDTLTLPMMPRVPSKAYSWTIFLGLPGETKDRTTAKTVSPEELEEVFWNKQFAGLSRGNGRQELLVTQRHGRFELSKGSYEKVLALFAEEKRGPERGADSKEVQLNVNKQQIQDNRHVLGTLVQPSLHFPAVSEQVLS